MLLQPRSEVWDLVVSSLPITKVDTLGLTLTRRCRKCVVHNREFASLSWFVVPTGRDYVPNGVLHQLILTRTRWAGWSTTVTNVQCDRGRCTEIVWHRPREDLIVTWDRVKWGDGLQRRNIPSRKSLQGSKCRSLSNGRWFRSAKR